jgi:outer membrane biosynthesis protein TonB
MPTVRVELSPTGDDESRRRNQRRGVKALVVLAGLVTLAFAAPEPQTAPEPAMRLTPEVTDFGRQDVGTRSARVVSLSNAVTRPFVISGIVAEGAMTQSDFSVDASRCGHIDPGAHCLAVVSFTPHTRGAQSARFRIVDAANATSQTIIARGTGTEPPTAPEKHAVVKAATPDPTPTPIPSRSRAPTSAPTPILTPTPVPVPEPAPQPSPSPKMTTTPKECTPEETTKEAQWGGLPKTSTDEEPLPTTTQAPPPTTAAVPRKRNRTLDRFKRIGRVVAFPVFIGRLILRHNRNHGGGQQQQNTDHRIEVSPGTLNVTEGRTDVVTVKNIGRDDVTINSVTIAGEAASLFGQQGDCQTLAAGQECHIWVSMEQRSGVRATLVVDSKAGRATVDLVGQNFNDLK